MNSNLARWSDPFSGLSGLHRELDDMFNSFFGQTSWPLAGNLPAMDVYTENDKQLVAEVHLPGFTKDDVDISVHEGVLDIRGQKQEKGEQKDKSRTYMVRQSSASFFRRVALPRTASAEDVKASFDDGILKVTVPLKQLPKPKKVAIKAGK